MEGEFVKLSIHRRHDFENEILLSSSAFPNLKVTQTIKISYIRNGENDVGSFLMRLNRDPLHITSTGTSTRSSVVNTGGKNIVFVSLLKNVADIYDLKKDDSVFVSVIGDNVNNSESSIDDDSSGGKHENVKTSPNRSSQCEEIDFLTVTIKDQFVSRSDMFQLKEALLHSWLYEGVRLDSMGCRVTVKELRKKRKVIKSGVITSNTVFTFRSRSSRVIWLVQVSSEMFDYVPSKISELFSPDDPYEDCVLNYDKFVTFMYHLFSRWRELEVTHSLSVIFFSRTYISSGLTSSPYKATSTNLSATEKKDAQSKTSETATGQATISTLQTDVDGRKFVDHYKPIVENETRTDWESLIHRIKREFVSFPRELNWNISNDITSRIPSVASQGNLLEAINTTLNVLQFHFMDRDLSRTGNSIVVVTAGCGVFEVEKSLASITKQRMMDNGIGSDCISLSLPPLHVTPFFMYKMTDEESADKSENVEEMLHDWKKYFESPHWLNVCFVGYKDFDSKDIDGTTNSTDANSIQITNNESNDDNDTEVERSFSEVLAAIQPMPRTLPTPLLCLMGVQTDNNNNNNTNANNNNGNRTAFHASKAVVKMSTSDNDNILSNSKESRENSLKTPPFGPNSMGANNSGTSNMNDFQSVGGSSTSVSPRSIENSYGQHFLESYSPSGSPQSRFLAGGLSNFKLGINKSMSSNNLHLMGTSFGDENNGSGGGSGIGNGLIALASKRKEKQKHQATNNSSAQQTNAAPNINNSKQMTPNINNSKRCTNFSQNPFRKQDEVELLRKRTHNRRRWSHVFPEGEQEFKRHAGVNWNSLTQPAILPMTSDFFPAEQELKDDFLFNHYVVTLDALDQTQYISHKDLLHELVLQRLAQDYQIVDTKAVDSTLDRVAAKNTKNTKGKTKAQRHNHITLSMGHRITQLRYNASDNVIEVTHHLAQFARNDYTSKNTIKYNYELWSSSLGKFTSSTQKFTKYSPEFPWNSLDNLICGDPQKHLTEGTRYRRILFAIIPDVFESPDQTRDYVEKFLKLLEYLKKRTEGNDEEIDIEIRNREGLTGDGEGVTSYKIDNKRTMKHYVVPLADLKKNGRYEWMILAMSSFFDPKRVFRIGYHWLVGSASRVESEVKGLSRRCAQFGLRLQQFPEYSLSSNLHIHSFLSPVLLVVEDAATGDLIEQNLLERFDFVDDGYRHTDYINVPGLGNFRFAKKGTFQRKSELAHQLIHRLGNTFVRILRDLDRKFALFYVENRNAAKGDDGTIDDTFLFPKVREMVQDLVLEKAVKDRASEGGGKDEKETGGATNERRKTNNIDILNSADNKNDEIRWI